MALNIMDEFPRNFNIEKNHKEKYNELQEEGVFEETSHLDVFLMSMALGWENDLRDGDFDEQYPLVNTQSMSDRQVWMVASIAIKEEGVSVLNDLTQVRKIADEYANGGFNLLLDKLQKGRPGSELKRLQAELMEKY